jgi:protein phosphatase slingshot
MDPSRNLVLNLTTQFEGVVASSSAANSPSDDILVKPLPAESPKFNRIAVNRPVAAVNVYQSKRDTVGGCGDLFSSRLDRVFEREERKQCREPDPVVMSSGGADVSRQNSWGSYDSAVVLRDVISRHSSWGSCDTRTLPSRNSSWGSYDIRPTMQYVSERGERPTIVESLSSSSSSSSAPTKIATEDVMSYHPTKRSKQKDQQKLLLPNCYSSSPTLGQGVSPKLANRATASQPNISGLGNGSCSSSKHSSLVKSLKEEFEAKASDTVEKPPRKNSSGGSATEDDGNEHVKSLPTSPVSEHPKVTQRPSPAASMEDISVRKLVGKYENGRARSKTFVQDSGCPRIPHQQPPVPPRVSSLDATVIGPRKFTKAECNPVVKTVVLPIQQSDIRASINRAANNKLQQGKSHPLTKLSFKQLKVNSTVYNSM